MWIATTRGFFSAVEHNTDPTLLVIRTRDHGDAETLRGWYEFWADNGLLTGPLPPAVITTYEHSDYPWRVIMPRAAWGEFVSEAIQAVDYGNFKDAVKTTQGPERASVYAGVWQTLLRLEDLDPNGRPRSWMDDVDTEPWDEYDAWEDDADITEDECPACDGAGEVHTGKREHDTGAPIMTYCVVCRGRGYLEAVTASEVSAYLAAQEDQ